MYPGDKWQRIIIQGISVQGISVQGISVKGVSVKGVSAKGVSAQGVIVGEAFHWYKGDKGPPGNCAWDKGSRSKSQGLNVQGVYFQVMSIQGKSV